MPGEVFERYDSARSPSWLPCRSAGAPPPAQQGTSACGPLRWQAAQQPSCWLGRRLHLGPFPERVLGLNGQCVADE